MLAALRQMFSTKPAKLTREQLAFWQTNGYLILPKFFSGAEMDRINQLVDLLWKTRIEHQLKSPVDILTGPLSYQAMQFKDVPAEARQEVYKLNNLFVGYPEIRALALDACLKNIIGGILNDEPIICNSLNLEKGSQQPFHFDTWYMPPPVDNQMVAAWFALEDAHVDAGPFIYYPGSHAIPPYRFSDGRLNENRQEMPLFSAYIDAELARRNLKTQTFCATKGDVFLWHAQLFHGGSTMNDPTRTRKSLVIHYWGKGDMHPGQLAQDAHGNYLATPLRQEA